MLPTMNRIAPMELLKCCVVLIVVISHHASNCQRSSLSSGQSTVTSSAITYHDPTPSLSENSEAISTSFYSSFTESSPLMNNSTASFLRDVTNTTITSSGLFNESIYSANKLTISYDLGTRNTLDVTAFAIATSTSLSSNSPLLMTSSSGFSSITGHSGHTASTPVTLSSSSLSIAAVVLSTKSEQTISVVATVTDVNLNNSASYSQVKSSISSNSEHVSTTLFMSSLFPSTFSQTTLSKVANTATPTTTTEFTTLHVQSSLSSSSSSSLSTTLSLSITSSPFPGTSTSPITSTKMLQSLLPSSMRTLAFNSQGSSSVIISQTTQNTRLTETSKFIQTASLQSLSTTSKPPLNATDESASSIVPLTVLASSLYAINSSVSLLPGTTRLLMSTSNSKTQTTMLPLISTSNSKTQTNTPISTALIQTFSIPPAVNGSLTKTPGVGRPSVSTTSPLTSIITNKISSIFTLTPSVGPTGPVPTEDASDNQRELIMIAAASGGGGAFIFILIACICVIQRRKRHNEQGTTALEDANQDNSDLNAHWNTLRKNNNFRKSIMTIGDDMYSDANEGIELEDKEKNDSSILSVSSDAVGENDVGDDAGEELSGTFTGAVKVRRNETSLLDLLNDKGVPRGTEASTSESRQAHNEVDKKMTTFKRNDKPIEKSAGAPKLSLVYNEANVDEDNEEPLPDPPAFPPADNDDLESPDVTGDALLLQTETDDIKIGIENPSLQLDSEEEEKKRLSEYYC